MITNSGIFAVTERTALPVGSVSKGASFLLNPSMSPTYLNTVLVITYIVNMPNSKIISEVL